MLLSTLFLACICIGPGAFESKTAELPSTTELIAAQDAIRTILSSEAAEKESEEQVRLLKRVSTVLEILTVSSKQLSEAQQNSADRTEQPAKESDGELDHLRPFRARLRLDCLQSKYDYLQVQVQMQTQSPKITSLPKDWASITPAALHEMLTLWDRFKMEILSSEISILEEQIEKWKGAKKKHVTGDALKKAIRNFLQSDSARIALKDKTKDEISHTDGVPSSLEKNRVELVGKGLELVDSIQGMVHRHEPAFEKLQTESEAFSGQVAKTRKQLVSSATREIFQERLTIQDLVNASRIATSQTNYAALSASTTAEVYEAEAVLDALDSYLSDKMETILETEVSTNVVWRFATAVWSYELTFGEEVSIKIGEILLLIVSVATGVFFAFLFSKLIGRFILPWFGISEGVAIAWRLIIRNVLALLFIFIAFQIFGVPLTAFAFVGGAAALAVGFGSKDIANNFMSGLIILTEQPVRVNDVIMYDSKQCLVTYIGLRSTRLRNLENHELVVPNSVLIDRMVVNLTLSDKRIRLVLPLEVDRIEDVNGSISRIAEALRSVEGVYQESPSSVYLKSVDTYYLNFEIHITIEFEDLTEIPKIQSRVFCALAGLFPTQKEGGEADPDSATQPPNDTEIAENAPSQEPTAESASAAVRPNNGKTSLLSRSARDIEHEINRLKRELRTKQS